MPPDRIKKLSAADQTILDKANRVERAAADIAAAQLAAKAKIDSDAQAKVAKQRAAAAAKGEAIVRIRADWNVKINSVVAAVLALRAANPGRNGINAGDNAGLDTIAGGNTNPVKLIVPDGARDVTKADVLTGMVGLDSSDSGFFKFRRKEVLVHGS